jgi:4'-phosphopantetheinyl transferase
VVAHGVLRAILGRYLNVAPASVRFVYGLHGKPSLAADFAASDIQFNLSHAGELAVVAVARTRAVGVDVEEVRPLPDLEAMARRYFAARETRALLALPAAQQHESFYRNWTRREACLKARGDGLAGAWERLETPEFALRDLMLPPGYVGAVAAAGSETRHVVPLDFEETRDPTIL